jgi:hypothetical protein
MKTAGFATAIPKATSGVSRVSRSLSSARVRATRWLMRATERSAHPCFARCITGFSTGFLASLRLCAALISAMWVSACGKFPVWRPALESYSSASRPRSLATPATRSNQPVPCQRAAGDPAGHRSGISRDRLRTGRRGTACGVRGQRLDAGASAQRRFPLQGTVRRTHQACLRRDAAQKGDGAARLRYRPRPKQLAKQASPEPLQGAPRSRHSAAPVRSSLPSWPAGTFHPRWRREPL